MNTICLALAMISLSSQQVMAPDSTDEPTPAAKFAMESASIAGSARNCKIDVDLLDEYITLAKAHISKLAKDKEESVLAKMDFTNTMLVAAIKPPEQGCKSFNLKFLTALHDLG